MNELEGRRRFVAGAAGALAVAAGLAGCHPGDDEDVSATEDLMREHGGLNRVLLVYDDCVRRLEGAERFPIDALARSAEIIRSFIEGYHEKLEEDFLFPKFEAKKRLIELVTTLRGQHRAGRVVTADVLRLAVPATLDAEAKRKELASRLRAFVRMYRPHEAREDTVLFPALRSVATHREIAELGDRFEDREHELFGKAGFEGVVERIAEIERTLSLADLDQFTPR